MRHSILSSIVLALSVAAVLAGCNRNSVPEQARATGVEGTDRLQETGLNVLTEAERADGWELLFDGQSISKWHAYGSSSVSPGWTIDEGALHYAPGTNGEDIISNEMFGDFELMLEWKVEEGGNSGIYYRAAEDAKPPLYNSGPEMQVLDNARHPDGKNPMTSAGANYAMHAPTFDASNPANEWNSVRIVADGAHVEHWLNGHKIVEYELWSDDWKTRVANSKWAEQPGYGLSRAGYIVLQEHGNRVWFRNIKIRPL